MHNWMSQTQITKVTDKCQRIMAILTCIEIFKIYPKSLIWCIVHCCFAIYAQYPSGWGRVIEDGWRVYKLVNYVSIDLGNGLSHEVAKSLTESITDYYQSDHWENFSQNWIKIQ